MVGRYPGTMTDEAPRRTFGHLGDRPRELRIELHRAGGDWRLTARGELDVAEAASFSARLDEVVRGGSGNLEIDLQGLDFIDSYGLHLLLNAHRQLVRQSRAMHVLCSAGAVLRVFELARLVETFSVSVMPPAGAPGKQEGRQPAPAAADGPAAA